MPGLSQEQIELDGVPLSLEQVCTVRPVCQRMPAISLSDGVPLTGKIGQKRARRPGERSFSGRLCTGDGDHAVMAGTVVRDIATGWGSSWWNPQAL